MTPTPVAPPRLFDRALREALDGAMSADRAAVIVAHALARAALTEVPEELAAFQYFVQSALRGTLQTLAGPAVTETCLERLSHVLWMASSTVRAHAPTPAQLASAFEGLDRDEPSGLRPLETPPKGVRASAPSAMQPPARASSPENVAAVARRSPTLGRISMAQVRAPSVREIGASRMPRGPVLVLSLDPTLARDTERELADRRPVIRIGSQAEFVRALTVLRGQACSVVVDAALPSIALGVFAGFASLLPPGSRVVLWGTDARQKTRLCTVFPQASEWIASGDATAVVPLLDAD